MLVLVLVLPGPKPGDGRSTRAAVFFLLLKTPPPFNGGPSARKRLPRCFARWGALLSCLPHLRHWQHFLADSTESFNIYVDVFWDRGVEFAR